MFRKILLVLFAVGFEVTASRLPSSASLSSKNGNLQPRGRVDPIKEIRDVQLFPEDISEDMSFETARHAEECKTLCFRADMSCKWAVYDVEMNEDNCIKFSQAFDESKTMRTEVKGSVTYVRNL